jgi:hypothetical protein
VAALGYGGAAGTVGEQDALQKLMQDKPETVLFIHQSVYQLNFMTKQSFEHISWSKFF